MSKQKNAKIHNVYLLDRNKLHDKFSVSETLPIETIIDKIMANGDYTMQQLKPDIFTDNFSVRLYFTAPPSKSNKLSLFCSTFVEEDQEIIKFRAKNASSVLFIWNDTNIFAITSGQGYRAIEAYCTPRFGLMIATNYLEYLKITALDSNEFSGNIHSTKTIFSNEMSFVDVDTLDTIYKEITGRLNDTELIHNLLDLDEDDKKSSTKIIAKDYFQLSSSMSFDRLMGTSKNLLKSKWKGDIIKV